MSDRSEQQAANVELSRRAFEAFDPEDPAAILEFASDDVEGYSPPDFPNPADFTGHDGYRDWVGAWLEAWEKFSVDVQRMEPVGERHVVTTVLQRATGKASGIDVELTIAYLTEVREGEIGALHLYWTPEQATAAAEKREAG